MSSTTRTLTLALVVLGGLLYADWVLQLFLPVQASVTTSFISELSAANQPHHTVFRIADLAGGVLLVAGGAGAWLLTRRWPVTWSSLVLFGVCVSLEAALPLHTTYTFAAILPKTGTGLWWSRVSEPHGVASFVETVSFLVLFASCTLALRRASGSAGLRRALAATGLVAVLCGVVDAALTALLLTGGHVLALGLTQRTGVTLTAVWLMAAPTWLLSTNSGRPATRLSEPGSGSAAFDPRTGSRQAATSATYGYDDGTPQRTSTRREWTARERGT